MAHPVKLILAGLLALSAVSAHSAADGAGASLTRARYSMGTLLSITLKGRSEQALEPVFEEMFSEVDRWDRLLSTYQADSDISRVNRLAPEEVAVSSGTSEMVLSSLAWAVATQGAFDPTAGVWVKLWGFDGGNPRVPSDGEIEERLPLIGYDKVEIKGSSVRLSRKGMSLDMGAIGKGWALDRALEKALAAPDILEAQLNFGGQLLFWSTAPATWTVGYRAKPGAFTVTENGSISTSDVSERFSVMADPKDMLAFPKKYGHIFDPGTGRPAEPCVMVTVWAPSATEADVLSTAIFVMGPEKGLAFAKDRKISATISYWDSRRGLRTLQSPAWAFKERK